jgi:glycosyltransferase involved in cell wall biosynthesis
MENPLVSILIPFKNTEGFLTECMQSIKEQDYRNWEVLAVDDHSADDSRKTTELFATQDHRFRVLKNNGYGIIPALQTAYDHSRGSLVTRMDSDDVMPPNKLQHMVDSLLMAGPGHLAVGKVKYFSIRGISNGYERYENWLNILTEKGDNFSEIYKECTVPSPCWMVFRTDLDTSGAFREERYPEDYDLCFRFYQAQLKVIPCTEVLHYWRDYDQRTSRTSVHYGQNYFLDIKLHYFLKLDREPQRPLAVWGAGNKGKIIAESLQKKDIDFKWLCDNPKKIGKKIYGKVLEHYKALEQLPEAQSIITVANDESQAVIREFLIARGQLAMSDYFFFC